MGYKENEIKRNKYEQEKGRKGRALEKKNIDVDVGEDRRKEINRFEKELQGEK